MRLSAFLSNGFPRFLTVAKNTFFYPKQTLNCRGSLLDISSPVVMGILNLTPDSFFDGGQYNELSNAIGQCADMLAKGAAIIDVGAMSSRPGAELISPEEEIKRLEPILPELIKAHPKAIFSIDTVHSAVAEKAMEWGVHIVNDISAGSIDQNITAVAAENNAPYILMHMQGLPNNMQQEPDYENIVLELTAFFQERIRWAKEAGCKDIILDPGFGFGKNLQHNYELLRGMDFFKNLDLPILVGISRKSMINKVIGTKAAEALNGTTAAHMLALLGGAQILRVHDVREALECIQIFKAYNGSFPE